MQEEIKTYAFLVNLVKETEKGSGIFNSIYTEVGSFEYQEHISRDTFLQAIHCNLPGDEIADKIGIGAVRGKYDRVALHEIRECILEEEEGVIDNRPLLSKQLKDWKDFHSIVDKE